MAVLQRGKLGVYGKWIERLCLRKGRGGRTTWDGWVTVPIPLKFIYSEKATKFYEISTVDLSYVVPVKSMVEISQNFVAFSEYMNFKSHHYAPIKISCRIKKLLTVFRFEILQSTFDEIFLRIPGTVFWKGIEPRPLGTILSTCPLQCINGVSQIPSWSVQEGTLWQLFWKIVQLIWIESWIKKTFQITFTSKSIGNCFYHLF